MFKSETSTYVAGVTGTEINDWEKLFPMVVEYDGLGSSFWSSTISRLGEKPKN